MDAKILQLPDRGKVQRGWICGCGSQHWVLYEDGSVYCPECQCISTVIKVIRRRDYKHVMKDAAGEDGVDSEELIAAMMKKIEDQKRELVKLHRAAEGKSEP